ncbi:HesB/YadR/YfhF [Lunatimonas lonarensis]|uniref:HesB/YadR/YfhF n=1 Tax=Lunatimonas lonarensis TaxID=1232681 RepID=R7ZTF7_9BACT|nr:ADP-ribosylglycohydrolase family protein [Lunatimonas lonarensis]EON77431.1 HesB/YadR/YfhF [Lunatimonas lonarensis]
MITSIRRNLFFLFYCLCLLSFVQVSAQTERRIPLSDFRDKLFGYWNGQLVGNYLGFPFENLYDEEPLPLFVDRYYTFEDAERHGLRMNLNDRRAYIHIMADALGGAWSDDDTDIELVMLHGLEEYGLDMTYEQVADLRKKHVNRFIWASNARVRELLHKGEMPPQTGSKEKNDWWYGITSHLINEIWGVVYPGMIQMAAQKSEWGAKITNDDWATHPTILYGSMFSAAFFENDIKRLLSIGLASLPPESPFKKGVHNVMAWAEQEEDWKDCRKKIHDAYFEEVEGFKIPFPMMGSMVNGLNGVMALLYGNGDFERTLGIAVSTGYDCDNQAATLGGLLGVIHGGAAIPERFTHNLPSRGRWQKPFNDTYINYSRDLLPNYYRISDIVERIMGVAQSAIIVHGGRVEEVNGESYFVVSSDIDDYTQ